MANRPDKIQPELLSTKFPTCGRLSEEWHNTARENAETKIEGFITTLVSKAEAICAHEDEGIVTKNHVDEALNSIKKGYNNSILVFKAGLLFTSLLTGIFVPNLFSKVSEAIDLATNNQPTGTAEGWIAFYAIGSLVTLGLSVWLLIRDEI